MSRKKDHRWETINNNQHRCINCKCVRTRKYTNADGKITVTFQKDDSTIIKDFLECTGKVDLSEFYN